MTSQWWIAVALAGALALACESSRDPGPPGGDQGGGDQGGGGSDGGAPADDTSSNALFLEASGGPPLATRLDLDLVAVVLYVDRSPTVNDPDAPCDAGGGNRLDARSSPSVDLRGGRTPVLTFDREGGGSLRELALVLRQGVLVRDNRGYKVHASALCTMPDGQQYTFVRLRPPAPVDLGGGRDHDLVATLEPGAIRTERAQCGTPDDVEECAVGDDPADDGDPSTRLVFSFAPDLPLRAESR